MNRMRRWGIFVFLLWSLGPSAIVVDTLRLDAVEVLALSQNYMITGKTDGLVHSDFCVRDLNGVFLDSLKIESRVDVRKCLEDGSDFFVGVTDPETERVYLKKYQVAGYNFIFRDSIGIPYNAGPTWCFFGALLKTENYLLMTIGPGVLHYISLKDLSVTNAFPMVGNYRDVKILGDTLVSPHTNFLNLYSVKDSSRFLIVGQWSLEYDISEAFFAGTTDTFHVVTDNYAVQYTKGNPPVKLFPVIPFSSGAAVNFEMFDNKIFGTHGYGIFFLDLATQADSTLFSGEIFAGEENSHTLFIKEEKNDSTYYRVTAAKTPDPIETYSGFQKTRDMALSNFPNPFQKSTQLFFQVPFGNEPVLSIFSTDGKKVFQFKGLESPGSVLLKGWGLIPGIYLAKLTSGRKTTSRRVVFQK